MSEKIKTVYSVQDLYAGGIPVIINSFALLQDIKNGGMLCSLRLINIGNKTINRVKVKVMTDSESAEGMEDNICITRDADVTVNITLNGFGHRRAEFEITEISYTDGSSISVPADTKWQSLALPETVEEYLGDEDLVREFRTHFEEAVYFPMEEGELWFCACGELNHKNELACHSCGRTLAGLKKYGVVELKNAVAKQKRLDAINKDKFDKAYKQVLVGQKTKRNRILLYIIIAAVVITLVALLIVADGSHYTQAI